MPNFNIAGVIVEFPKTPYPCQIQYMEHVIRALNCGTNALLESPTGTGKTLCLLCATLAWQNSKRGKSVELTYHTDPAAQLPVAKSAPYMIVYATRTHSQLAQVVSELRETSYKPRMTVMGSREQLCVHEKVSKLKSNMMNHACNSLNAKRGCMYKNNLENYIESSSSMDNTSMMDIEEMVKLGNHRKICPYFHSREFSTSSDLVLLPYNYLLDSTIRRTLKLEWDKCIIIFDEAHNLERVAADAASFSLSSTEIALCIQELQQVLTTLRDEQQNSKAPAESEAQQKLNVPGVGTTVSSGSGVQKPTLSGVIVLLKALFELERRLDGLQVSNGSGQQQASTSQAQAPNMPGLVYPGLWLLQLMIAVGLSNEQQVEELRRCCNILMEAAQDALGFDSGAVPAAAVEPKLQAFALAFDRILRSARNGSVGDYKVYIADEVIKNTSYGANGSAYTQISATGGPPKKKRVINFWCFSTGVAMSELQKLGVKSLLLTSGTLSPMAALREDIKLHFPIQLENPHVIGDNQMWVAALPVGVSGKALNSSFQSRDTNVYKDELGQSVLQICLTMAAKDEVSLRNSAAKGDGGWGAYGVSVTRPAVPPAVRGGVLIFFPSYAVMENTCARWKEIGVFDKLRGIVGSVLMETRGSSGAPSTSTGGADGSHKGRGGSSNYNNSSYNTNNNSGTDTNFMLAGGAPKKAKNLNADEDDEGSEEFRTIVGQFEHAIKTYGGCVLMAVCRGKVSEGIDFTDSKGRVVIITGIPFAPYMDPWVILKKQYLDEKSSGVSQNTALNALTSAVDASATAVGPTYVQRVIAPSAYPAVMGPPAVPSAALVKPAMPPPAPPAVQATAAPAAKSASLTGQGWYSQTAGRAVNQCIGRVIRHNRDWGTVFLLDDRFMNDRQIAQLSGWVKPRVKKFTNFGTALQAFRTFITNAAQDKNLISKEKQENMLEAAPDIERFRRREQDKLPENGFMRQVEIHESSLTEEGEENTFLHPSLLLSQQPASSASGQWQSGSGMSNNSRVNVDGIKDTEADLMSIFQRKRRVPGTKLTSSTFQDSLSGAGDTSSKAGADGGLLGAFSRSRAAPASTPVPARTTPVEIIDLDEPSPSPLTITYSEAGGSGAGRTDANPSVMSFGTAGVLPKPSSMGPPVAKPTTTPAPSFGLSSAVKATAFHVPEKIVRNKDTTIADYFTQPAQPTQQSQQEPAQSQSSQMSQGASQRPFSQAAKNSQRPMLDIPKFRPGVNTSSASGSSASVTVKEEPRAKSFLSYLSQLDDDMQSVNDPVTEFHQQIALLKPWLSKENLLSLKQKLTLVKSSGIRSVSQVRHFVEELLPLLKSVDPHLQLSALLSFSCMLPPALADEYAGMVNESVEIIRKPAPGSGKLSAKASAAKSELSLSQRNINEHIRSVLQDSKRRIDDEALKQSGSYGGIKQEGSGGGGSHFIPSKRAKSIFEASIAASAAAASGAVRQNIKEEGQLKPAPTLQLSQAGSSGAGGSRASFLSKLSGMDNITLTGAVKPSNLTSAGADRHSRVGSAKLTCGVCKEKALEPCAGRCGHVCCQVCWTKWLKVNASCPMCRAPADKSSVTRIIIK